MSSNVKTIIATIVSAQQAPELISAGATTLRINCSHSTPEIVTQVLGELDQLLSEKVPVYLDLQGNKMRLSKQQPIFMPKVGSNISIVAETSAVEGSEQILLPKYVMNIVHQLPVGASVSIADAAIGLTILDPAQGLARVERAETKLRPKKGVNISPHPVSLDSIMPRDMEFIAAAKPYPFAHYALSFATSPRQIQAIRTADPTKLVAAKLELPLEPEQVRALSEVCDEIWLCRGDLGAQLGLPKLGRYAARFARSVPTLPASCRAVLAGEVLDHMIGHPIPTRSEVCHAYQALEQGYRGFVLSNETAFGHHGIQCVRTLVELIAEYEIDV